MQTSTATSVGRSDTAQAAHALAVGSRVRLIGLQSTPELNQVIGTVVAEPDAASGRVPVKLLGPLASTRPAGIKVKPQNIEALPPQRAVQLTGFEAVDVQLTGRQAQFRPSDKWLKCQVPTLLGIPLVLQQLAPTDFQTRLPSEQPAVLMVMDPLTGFAPNWVQLNGLGPVLLARADGQDFSTKEMWELHDYNGYLMDRWSDWMEEGFDTPAVAADHRSALTPEAFESFTRDRAEDELLEEQDQDDSDCDDGVCI